MMRQPFLIAMCLITVGFAGCSDDGGAAGTDDTLGVDDEVKVTSDTGAIRGVVVDASIVPIAGADVSLLNTEHATQTNENGEFVFSGLEPTSYFIRVSKPGFEDIQSSTDVVAGDEKPPIVRVQMVRIPGFEPASEMRQFDGFLQCSVRFVVNAISACSQYPLPEILEDNWAVRYDDLETPPTFAQSEMVWDNSQQLGASLKLEYTDDFQGQKDNYRIHQGESPLMINADKETFETKHWDDQHLYIRVFTGDYQDTGLSLTLQQRFTIFTSIYENYTPPEGWMFIDNNELAPPPE